MQSSLTLVTAFATSMAEGRFASGPGRARKAAFWDRLPAVFCRPAAAGPVAPLLRWNCCCSLAMELLLFDSEGPCQIRPERRRPSRVGLSGPSCPAGQCWPWHRPSPQTPGRPVAGRLAPVESSALAMHAPPRLAPARWSGHPLWPRRIVGGGRASLQQVLQRMPGPGGCWRHFMAAGER
jgi:hypothetical protein